MIKDEKVSSLSASAIINPVQHVLFGCRFYNDTVNMKLFLLCSSAAGGLIRVVPLPSLLSPNLFKTSQRIASEDVTESVHSEGCGSLVLPVCCRAHKTTEGEVWRGEGINQCGFNGQGCCLGGWSVSCGQKKSLELIVTHHVMLRHDGQVICHKSMWSKIM